jgi:hypothetical protein
MANPTEFLNPKSMATPGAAAAAVLLITNVLNYEFDLPARYIALTLSVLLGVLTVSHETLSRIEKVLYCVINSLVIFAAAMGANKLTDEATLSNRGPVSGQLLFAPINLQPLAVAMQGTLQEGSVLRVGGSEIFVVVDGHLKRVPDMSTVRALGLNSNAVREVSESSIQEIGRGSDYPALSGPLVRGRAAVAYVLESGKRREIPDQATFDALGYHWADVVVLSDEGLKSIPEGPPMSKRKRFFRAW